MNLRFCVPSVGCGDASGAASVTLRGPFSALKQPIKLWLQKFSSPIRPCYYEGCILYLGYQEGVNNDLSSWGGLIFSSKPQFLSPFRDFLFIGNLSTESNTGKLNILNTSDSKKDGWGG